MIGFGQNLAIGDTYQGGIIFYLDGSGGGLIAAPTDQSTKTSVIEWGCDGTNLTKANGKAIGKGAQNTIDIEAGCTNTGTAADICANLTLGGYSDWFLPSRDELNEMYLNLHQQGLGGFASDFDDTNETGGIYWSSTERSRSYAWVQEFRYGDQYWEIKSFDVNVRAIRAF